MPPKAASAPTRGRGRVRGVGRGRGGATGSTRASAASEAPAEESPALQSTEAADATQAAAAPATTTPGAAPVAQMTPSAATPAPSSAPTPAASAVAPKAPARTSSIRRPAPSATPGPSTRGAKKTAIPAPKAVRRSKEERETLEKAEQKKRADEARVALREQRRSGRGRGDFKSDRGRGGKARGGFMGDRERNIREQVASGPFSAGQVSAEASFARRPGGGPGYSGGGGGGGGGRGGGGGGARIKVEGGAYGSLHSIKPEDGGYISSDEDAGEEGPRQDIDIIDISDDEDDQGGGRGMIPVRLSRVEHKEREKPISADVKTKDAKADPRASAGGARTPSPTAVRKAKQRVKDIEVTASQRKWKGAWVDSDDSEPEPQIKPEPTEDPTVITAEPMDTDVPIKESSSPETRRKSSKARVTYQGLPLEAPADQTLEEQREWMRHHMDLELIREELGQLAIPATKPAATAPEGEAAGTDAQGDTDMGDAVDATELRRQQGEEQAAPVEDRRADRVYLFQFPPILPELRIATGPGGVKKEAPPSPELSRRTKPAIIPGSSTDTNTEAAPINLDDIPDFSEAIAAAAAASSSSNTKETAVKVEDNGGADIPSSAGQTTYRDLPSGYVGKFRIHASGRATFDWGGTSLQVGMGTDVKFLQDVVAARFYEPEEKLEHIAGVGGKKKEVKKEDKDVEKGPGGEVMGLGQVRGKFVVTPNWEDIVGQRI
ncbi:hypothetical protein AAFC00_000636 [Neodothiora populina]|uniref:RNA polymerase III RPC4 n=1 Tax=Neodothiora populina TaxID=2781224 RepID=A0ABR3PDI4_9PEZI